MKKGGNGFTLIELLVVIAIIALLLSILLPGLKLAKDYAKKVICASRLRQVGVAMTNYSQSFPNLPDAKDRNGKDEGGHTYAVYRAVGTEWLDANGRPIPLRWAKLYEAGFMDTPELFYCPGNRVDLYKYENYCRPAPWGTLNQDFNTETNRNQWVRIGYTYYPIARHPIIANGYPKEFPKKFTELHPTLPYATDVLWGLSNLSHQRQQNTGDDTFSPSNRYSVNALYADAHVSNCNDARVFSHDVWTRWSADYDVYNFTVFRLIGGQ